MIALTYEAQNNVIFLEDNNIQSNQAFVMNFVAQLTPLNVFFIKINNSNFPTSNY